MFDDPVLVFAVVAMGIGLMVLASRIRSRSVRRLDEEREQRRSRGGSDS